MSITIALLQGAGKPNTSVAALQDRSASTSGHDWHIVGDHRVPTRRQCGALSESEAHFVDSDRRRLLSSSYWQWSFLLMGAMITERSEDARPLAVETRALTKIFQDRVVALSRVDLAVRQGIVFALIGPNGAGKTTVFRLLLGLQRATAGEARIFGERMHPNAAHLRRRIGYLPTGARMPPSATPIEYLRFVGEVSGVGAEETSARIATLLRDLDLLGAAGQRIGTFSTGMMTRLGIAASLINDPDLLIWDEPTSGLDPIGRRQITDLIKTLRGRRTILVSTHVLGDVERVCDEVGVLYRGRLIYSGPLGEMKRRAQTNTIELEIEGDGERLVQRGASWELSSSWEWNAPLLRVSISESAPLAMALSQLLAMVAEEDLALLAINMAGDQLEEAFLRRLDEDRSGVILSDWEVQ
jgi:ABC-2 type transport system ATP-binding protein